MNRLIIVLTFMFVTVVGRSQTVEDGIKYLYYEKWKSATETLEKVVASNPKDAYAVYWLGQVYIAEKELAKAKGLYQKTLSDGVNSPWMWVGIGNVELLENGDINSAKQKFEQAITASTPIKGKMKNKPDSKILAAIGRANAAGSSKHGDADYGIEKLQQAAVLDPANPDIFMNMGICYLKKGADHGGDAVVAFRKALTANPKYARAPYRIGLIYQAQQNYESMIQSYSDAIAADPSFAPVYLAYFKLYQNSNVNEAKDYLDKYIQYADKDCNTDYLAADYLFRARKYEESIAKGKEMESGICKDYHRVHLLYAYNYSRLNKPTVAKVALENFFAKEPASKIEPEDYAFAGNYLVSLKGSELQAIEYLKLAIQSDTSKAAQRRYIDTIVSAYKSLGNAQERFNWIQKKYESSSNPSNTDIFGLGAAAQEIKNYPLAIKMFSMYIEKHPEHPYGYTALVRASQVADTTGAMSVEPMKMYINNYLIKDTVKNKQAIAYYNAMLGKYYNDVNDIDASIAAFEQAVRFTPENTQYAGFLQNLRDFKKAKSAPAPSATPAKK